MTLINNILGFIPYISILIILASCGGNPQQFEVNGKIEHITTDYLYAIREHGDSIMIDTVQVNKQGEFSFSGITDTLEIVNLYFNRNTQSIYILVNKGQQIKIEGDALMPDLIKVKGGDINNDLTAFKEKNAALLKSRADILNSTQTQTTKNDSSAVKNYVVELKNINFELSNAAATYIKANPEKIASVMLINTFFKDETSLARLDEGLNLLKGKAADFSLTAELRKYRDKVRMSAVGSAAPNFTIKDSKEKEINLINYRGKYIFLSFVSTTCEVCKAEKAEVIKVYNQLKEEKKNIEFITIIKDIEEQPLDKNMTDSIKWSIIPVKGGWSANTFEMYYIRELPYNILISPDGIILERDIPYTTLRRKLEELISNNQK